MAKFVTVGDKGFNLDHVTEWTIDTVERGKPIITVKTLCGGLRIFGEEARRVLSIFQAHSVATIQIQKGESDE